MSVVIVVVGVSWHPKGFYHLPLLIVIVVVVMDVIIIVVIMIVASFVCYLPFVISRCVKSLFEKGCKLCR